MRSHTTRTFLAGCALASALLFWMGAAAAERTVQVIGPDTLQISDENGQSPVSWTVGTTIRDVLRIGGTLYVAGGPVGILIYDLMTPGQPSLVGRAGQGHDVIKLAYNGQSLLAVATDYSSLVYSLLDPHRPQLQAVPGRRGAPVAAPGLLVPGPPARAPIERWAKVTAVRDGSIWVSTKEPGQVLLGDRFLVHSQRRVRTPDPTGTHYVYAPTNEPTGMFVVSRVTADAASGQLPRGTIAHVGDLAEPTADRMSAPLVGPKLWYGMWRFYGSLVPLIPVGGASSGGSSSSGPTDSFAMLNQFALEYYFRVPLKLGVQAMPMGFTVGKQSGISTELSAQLAFSSSYFELGVAPGAELHVLGPTRFLIGWMMRAGSLDGLNLIFHNSFGIDGNSAKNKGPSYISLNAEINIPLTQRFGLYLTGGGSTYYAYATIGLKNYLRGGGGPGSLILHVGAGGAYLADNCVANVDTTNYQQCMQSNSQGFGPVMAIGLDARF